MSEHTPEEIAHHVRVYVRVFVTLMILTVLTVAVAWFHLPLMWAILVAMVIATIKGGLVGAFFMHLVGERPIIFAALLLTVVFFALLMVLPIMTSGQDIQVIHGS